MTVQTLDQTVNRRLSRTARPAPRRHVHASLTARRPMAASEAMPKPSKLEEVEDRLLAAALERYENVDGALDGALDDMSALNAELHRTRRRPLLLRSATSLNRMEDLLLEAVVRAHPNAERAFDRLLDDVAGEVDEATARAEFDMTIDNDFDGMA
jgi:hypothetical protein